MTKDGGPAFPSGPYPHKPNPAWSALGMTLRDYFAAAALQGIVTSWLGEDSDQGHAEKAYKIADAMIAERENDDDV